MSMMDDYEEDLDLKTKKTGRVYGWIISRRVDRQEVE